jgi:hypothetical protein
MRTNKYTFRVATIVLLSFIISLTFSCQKDYFIPVILSESDTISFKEDLQPIFNKSCLGSGCHSTNGGLQPFLDVEIAYESLIGGNYVDTINPESSNLYKRISATSNFMPPASKLPPVEIQQILMWIKQGAQSN